MNDYTWPSVYFAYFFFTICLVLALYFFLRSLKDGYWSRESEALRFRVFEADGVNAEARGGGNNEGEPERKPEAVR